MAANPAVDQYGNIIPVAQVKINAGNELSLLDTIRRDASPTVGAYKAAQKQLATQSNNFDLYNSSNGNRLYGSDPRASTDAMVMENIEMYTDDNGVVDWKGFNKEYGIGSAEAGTGKDISGTSMDGLKTGLAGVQAVSGLMNAYTGMQGLGLAKDQFGFQKAAANRDVANQAKLLNESRLNSGNVGLALAGGTMTEAQKGLARDKIVAGNVDGSAIG